MVAALILGRILTARHGPGGSLSALLVIHLPANITVKAQRVKQPAQLSLAVQLPDDETFVSFIPATTPI